MSTRNRRGVALLAALWLVVAIAAVAAQFAIEARERRNVGILAAERGIQRAAAMGALAMTQAKLEYAMRVAPASANAARLSSSDPWLGIDSTYSGTVYVDSVPVAVTARDLGEQLNINQLTETDLQSFFTFLLRDFSKATQLSQAIMDWRDADSLPRPSGAERDDYIKAGLLALPTNASFRDVEELQNVMGMTPEIYATIAPFLTTRGNGQVNINTAPIPVLRALPGMTDAIVAAIIQYRSGGRRIDNVAQVIDVGATRGGGRGGAGVTTLQGRLTTTTNNVEFTFEARVGPQAPPSKLTVVMQRAGNQGTLVSYKQWQ
jgi:general secretion pathway protein K